MRRFKILQLTSVSGAMSLLLATGMSYCLEVAETTMSRVWVFLRASVFAIALGWPDRFVCRSNRASSHSRCFEVFPIGRALYLPSGCDCIGSSYGLQFSKCTRLDDDSIDQWNSSTPARSRPGHYGSSASRQSLAWLPPPAAMSSYSLSTKSSLKTGLSKLPPQGSPESAATKCPARLLQHFDLKTRNDAATAIGSPGFTERRQSNWRVAVLCKHC